MEPLIEGAQEWTPTDWWRLELRSFIVAPTVVRDLAVLAPEEAVKDEYTKITAGSCLQSLAYLFSIAGPLVGAAMMIRWAWTQGARFDLPIVPAGVLTALALLVSLYGLIQERRHPRATSRGRCSRWRFFTSFPASCRWSSPEQPGAPC
ncbi:hypothetical protein L2X99_12030 [Microbacterium sp. KUDC0406]|uniref:hypothetical protein n=1 Tax=Microbacterium sp. KUDC0406 TaxID=2909588 RepID=UPI001F489F54|nr:hypothetical protein [Microbacterium sp. KUDC0406]UJP09171.1 hypothetical protein L2X99_12030 [Microbacterium sp. KUDC0406]